MHQYDLHRVFVEGLKPRLAKVRHASFPVGLRPLHNEEVVSVFSAQRRREHAAPRTDEIRRRDGVAVGPPRIGAKVKRVNPPVRRDVPRRRLARPRLTRHGIRRHQPFEQRANHIGLRTTRNRLRIRVRWFRRIAEVQNIALACSDDRRLAATTTRQRRRQQAAQKNKKMARCDHNR